MFPPGTCLRFQSHLAQADPEKHEVEADEIIGKTSLTASPSFGLEPVDQIDGVEEPAARSGAYATARDRAAKRTDAASSGQRARHRQMRLARSGPANQDDVALLRNEVPAGGVAHQALVDRCA